jgi:ribosome-associated protein
MVPAEGPSRRRRDADTVASPDAREDERAPSKTQRKAAMHALQDLGVALVELDPQRLSTLARDASLPDRLVDAVAAARSITAHGGRKRALQYVGKLMRSVDPEPIRRQLDAWAHGRDIDTARAHALERWRERLLADPSALDALAVLHPTLDRPRFRALIARASAERDAARPPHAYRELYRELKALDRMTQPTPAPSPPPS